MHDSELIRSPIFQGLPADLLLNATIFFERRTLDTGAPLWFEGQPATELAIVVSGSLRVRAGVQFVGEVSAGELAGETSVFVDERRSATVDAVAPTVLWLLKREDLDRLSEALPEVHDRLLTRALSEMARRVRAVDLKIASMAEGTDAAPTKKQPSNFLKALRSLTTAIDDSRAAVLPALRALPGLREASTGVLTTIAQVMTPRTVESDVAVFLEGDEGRSAFVIAEGSVRVLRNVKGGRARRLATLERGSLFGTGSLISGDRRNASVITSSSPCRLFEIDQSAMEKLTGDAGRAWRIALLHALRRQVVGASNHLAELKGGTSWADRQRIRRAAESIVAWQDDPDPWVIEGRVR
jgi:CRP-like cAMP-binding protein